MFEIAEPTGKCLRRLAEPSCNKECTILAGQALGYSEGTTFKHSSRCKISQMKPIQNVISLHLKASKLWGRNELRSLVIKLNRRDPILVEQPSVDAAASFGSMEAWKLPQSPLAIKSAQSSPDRR
ncbi:MAG: hypothetical protein COB74_06045 [Shewanella sp.]|nr:MAG: hypothetical protein COB74_06045 [Shewanella sp.]